MRKLKTPKIPTPLKTWLHTLADLLLWSLLTGIIIFYSPDYQPAVLTFFTILPLALLLSLKFIFKTRRALLLTILISALLALSFYNLDQLINVGLLIGLIITIELFFVVKQ